MLLTVTKNNLEVMVDWWYMDTGCFNRIIGNSQWLINFDSIRMTKIRCDDDKYLVVKGMGNVLVKVRDGKNMLIKDVWYVPGMKSNFDECRSIVGERILSDYERQPTKSL